MQITVHNTNTFMLNASSAEVVAAWRELDVNQEIRENDKRILRALITNRAQRLVEETYDMDYQLFRDCGIPVIQTRHRRHMNKMYVILYLLMIIYFVGAAIACFVMLFRKR